MSKSVCRTQLLDRDPVRDCTDVRMNGNEYTSRLELSMVMAGVTCVHYYCVVLAQQASTPRYLPKHKRASEVWRWVSGCCLENMDGYCCCLYVCRGACRGSTTE